MVNMSGNSAAKQQNPGQIAMRIKDCIMPMLLILFVVFSFLFISPEKRNIRSGCHSSELGKTTVKEGNTERTDFRDATGKITNAADVGYATCIAEVTENSRVEKFYNDRGEPVRRFPGYYGLLREYDESGNTIHFTYLDRDGVPCMTGYGYSAEERKYDSAGRVTAVYYFDADGCPVFTRPYGSGRINEYDEYGNNTRITYIDTSGEPTVTSFGYASMFRRFYGSESPAYGRVESEFYYDNEGKPTALSLGEYGIHEEYDQNGRVSVLTYLGADGEPIVTNKGYTTISRTYHDDNSVATELYYDIDGNPFALPDGQYGVRKEGSQTTYLNENGQEIFSIRRLLYNHSIIVIPLVFVIVLFSALTGKIQNAILLAFCLAAIVYMTLLNRDGGASSFSGFLRYYRRILFNSTARSDIIKNVWLFIPLGAVLYRIYPKAIILLVPVVLSVLIEGVQLLTGTGTCELDDVISNSLGGWIGYCMGKLSAGINHCISRRKPIQSA